MMKRNPSIELYRIFLMFSIVLLHCVCQGPCRNISLWSMLGYGVPGFVFISGYFGINFRWWKLAGLYGVALFAAMAAPIAPAVTGRCEYWPEVLRVWNPDSGFWFLHAYAVLSVFPCMFGVYCIHGTIRLPFANVGDFGVVNWFCALFARYMPNVVAVCFAAACLFLMALVIEFLRRSIISFGFSVFRRNLR